MTDRGQPRAPTINDIAREAGVSKSVVSRALLAQGGVNEDTRRRVTEVAERLGYVKNAMARGLVARRTRTLGVLVRDVTDPFHGHLRAALEERAAQRGYQVVATAGTRAADLTRERAALRTLLSLRVEGLVVCGGLLPAADITPFVRHVPTVVAGRSERDPALGSVSCDERDGAARLVAHLTGLGHRAIGVLTTPRHLSITRHDRGTATLEALRAAGAEPVPAELDEGPDSVARAVHALTAPGAAAAVTAIMCPSDHVVLRAMETLHGLGLNVPGDVSLTGFDGVAPLATPVLGLTTLRQPVREIGRRAADLVLDRPDDPHPDAAPRLLLRGTLVAGRTTAPPRP